MCTGIEGQACPAESSTEGTPCRQGSGDLCDPDDTCSGGICAAVIEDAGTICRPGSGDLCDPDEACTGIEGQACPADIVSSSSTVCREGSGNTCDPDETCSGNPAEACPDDVVEPAGAPCACSIGAGVCDENQACNVEISIDIKPGSDPNSINPKSMGLVPVAILGSDTLDVLDVDYSKVEFELVPQTGGAIPIHMGLEDVNDDGFIDLVLLYIQKETGVSKGDVEACLSGETFDGQPFLGCDAIKTESNKNKP
jgi:hypothetical protein